MISRRARPGDIVRARRTIHLSLGDRLAGRGVRTGRRGVVIATTGRRAKVTFDARHGGSGWVSTRSVGVARRFAEPVPWIVPVKAALVVFLGAPTLGFVVAYAWENRAFDGLPHAVGVRMGEGALAWGELAARDPGSAAIHLGFLSLVALLMKW
ncbi:hypothetical protein ACFU7D_08370 [Nocardioides sp. NPDC057577]|uniref:hypothetical protein n=1 Tax=Nocardioides sp. NPDC057577 TaxID=3346171 RepID=UPI0036714B05